MVKLPSRYKKINATAKGGFSDVIFCKDTHLSRKVAIKFIQDANEKRRILDELRALLTMRSKHVVQVYDIVPGDADSIGIVEEFIDGEDLLGSDFPKRTPNNYLKTIWQIASGIADIHAAGLIHRDIKPNNMKLDGEGVVKIFDFGLARNEGPKAVTKGFKGSRGFAAPELYSGKTVAFTSAIDTYAFGAVTIYLTCQLLPPELMRLPPLPVAAGVLRKLPIAMPDDLAALLESCLAHTPPDRPLMTTLRDEIARHILRNKHQALAVIKRKASFLNSKNKEVSLEYPSVGKFQVTYDGLRFHVAVAEGEVAINNNLVHPGMELPGSCVVAFGGPHRKPYERAFIPFDVSNPEVVL